VKRVFSGKEVIKSLRRIGFIIDNQRGSHVFMHNLERNVSVVVPMHKEIKKGTLHNILKKVGISLKELNDLI